MLCVNCWRSAKCRAGRSVVCDIVAVCVQARTHWYCVQGEQHTVLVHARVFVSACLKVCAKRMRKEMLDGRPGVCEVDGCCSDGSLVEIVKEGV
jgi:hypothetical protein